MTDTKIDDHIDVLQAERENYVLHRDHSEMSPGRKQYWQDRIDAVDAAIAALEYLDEHMG